MVPSQSFIPFISVILCILCVGLQRHRVDLFYKKIFIHKDSIGNNIERASLLGYMCFSILL